MVNRALLVNRERYGYMACPCRLAKEAREADKYIICPCTYREADVREYGSCYAGCMFHRKCIRGSPLHNMCLSVGRWRDFEDKGTSISMCLSPKTSAPPASRRIYDEYQFRLLFIWLSLPYEL